MLDVNRKQAKFDNSTDKMTRPPTIGYRLYDFLPVSLRENKDPEIHFKFLKDFKTRNDDIILTSSLKSGTHWVHEILAMLLAQRAEYNTLGPWWELNLEYLRDPQMVDKITRHRIFSTHLPFSFLPSEHVDKGYKIVYVNRNPKDRCVSWYNFTQGKIGVPVWTWSEYFDKFVMNDKLYTGWFNYTREMTAAVQNNPRNIFPVMYEGLIVEPKKHIINLATFLAVPYTDELIEEIVTKCSFKNLKENKFEVSSIIHPEKKSTLFRKGVIGDWKNWFTVHQSEQFDRLYEDEMKGVDVKFLYEQPKSICRKNDV